MKNKEEVLSKIQEIIRLELDNDNIILTENSKATDIDGWDSIANLQIIFAIEQCYSITFNALDIQNWKNIGELCNTLVHILNQN